MSYLLGDQAENMYFIPVGKICRRPPLICSPDSTVRAATQLMQERNITCVVVGDSPPYGIFTVRDLRRITATTTDNPATIALRDCMTPHLITLGEEACLFDAVSLMSRHNFHRVGVVDTAGNLVGILTDTDLLTFQTRSPLYLITEIERATSLEHLQQLNSRLFAMIGNAYGAGVEIRGVVQLLAHFNDATTRRVIRLMEQQEGISLPAGVAYLSLGSEGRQEQTLRTDQDSALVYADNFPQALMPEAERFAVRLIECLEQLGVPRCPGNTMASNPQWCHSLSGWKQILDSWILTPLPENMVNFGMFQDMRVLYGDKQLEEELRRHIYETASSNTLFFPSMARNITRFKPPLGMFGRLLVEKKGAQRGRLDLKKGGLFALVRGIALLALEVQIIGGSTWDKLDRLRALPLLAQADLDEIEESFSVMMNLRLGRQLGALRDKKQADNSIDPELLRERDRVKLRTALRGVEKLQKILRSHYQLDIIAR
jgi:CBS domain-containing protein